jgi:hypothetical protein
LSALSLLSSLSLSPFFFLLSLFLFFVLVLVLSLSPNAPTDYSFSKFEFLRPGADGNQLAYPLPE